MFKKLTAIQVTTDSRRTPRTSSVRRDACGYFFMKKRRSREEDRRGRRNAGKSTKQGMVFLFSCHSL
jgi:hypothetical protein